MIQRKRIVIALVIAMTIPAVDTFFKYFYGRSFFVERSVLALNAGIFSAALLSFATIYGLIYFLQRKAWLSTAIILCVIASGWLISSWLGSPIKKQDRDFADSIVRNIKNENISFANSSLRNSWESESVEDFELIGESPFHNVFFYKLAGNKSYLVSIYIRPNKEIQINDFGG